jgi:hypothetical protein
MCNNCSRHRRFQNLIFQDHELCLAGLWAQPSYYFPTCTIIIQDLKEYKTWFPQMYHNYLPNFDFPRFKIWFAEMYHNYSRSPQFWFSKMYHNYQRSQRFKDIDFPRHTIIVQDLADSQIRFSNMYIKISKIPRLWLLRMYMSCSGYRKIIAWLSPVARPSTIEDPLLCGSIKIKK